MATFKIVQDTEGSWTGPETAIVRGVRIPKARLDPSFREEDLDHFQTTRYDQSIKTDIGKPFDKSISIDNF